LLSWFDVAYATLNVFMVLYFFKGYLSCKKRAFQLAALGFVCLTISDLLWLFALIPLPNNILVLLGYLRLGLYTAFILSILRAMQLLDLKSRLER